MAAWPYILVGLELGLPYAHMCQCHLDLTCRILPTTLDITIGLGFGSHFFSRIIWRPFRWYSKDVHGLVQVVKINNAFRNAPPPKNLRRGGQSWMSGSNGKVKLKCRKHIWNNNMYCGRESLRRNALYWLFSASLRLAYTSSGGCTTGEGVPFC